MNWFSFLFAGVVACAALDVGCHEDDEQQCDGGAPVTDAGSCQYQVGTQCFEQFGPACDCAACPGHACAADDTQPAALICQ